MLPPGTIGASLSTGKSVQATVQTVTATTTRFTFRNTLSSPVVFRTQDLAVAGRRAAERTEIVVQPGVTTTRVIKLHPGRAAGAVTWPGRVQVTGEFLQLKGLTKA